MDQIALTDFRLETIVGILDSEQRSPQPIDVTIVLDLPIDQAARTGELHHSIDYAGVQAWFATLAQQGRWRLIESLALATCRLLLAPPGPGEARAPIHAVFIEIRKPTILVGAVPGVRVRRTADQVERVITEVAPGVVVERLEATPVQGAWRVLLDPGAEWHVPPTWSLHAIGGRGAVDGEPLKAGSVVARAPGRRVVASDTGMTVLAVGAPIVGVR